jgi:AcrR family transcriptional regulator
MNDENLSKGERTRAEILQAAHRLFLENGYHATSMRQIAQQAGIALGAAYNHFTSKEDIFLEVLVAHHPIYDMLPALEAAQGETVEEFIRDAAHRLVSNFGERMDFLNLMFIELVEFKGQHLTDLFQTFFPRALTLTQRFLQGRKEMRDIPLPILLRAFIGLFFSYVMTEILIGQNLPVAMQENALDYFVDIFLYGVLAEGRLIT